ncbi:MAG TPA: efflux RND transporter permease subunit [Steroidobacteraceae bacterium]|nr:efflux RND transporter permease subunit [Steroidobacteraceae bacterium]
MARFFIDRPIFAWVLAILVMMAGVLALLNLPVAQFPPLAPPSVAITVTYPGASAETVEGTVVQPIEQQMTGLDGLLYMSSESDKDGSITITLSFAQGTNPDIAQVQVQNKLQLALPRLPQAVQQQGVQVAKSAKNFLMAAAFVSTDHSMQADDIADFVASHVQDPVSRAPGVGNFQLFGAQYAMRIWLDPAKLDNYGLTAVDVTNSIKAQNIQVASGELGGEPAVAGQQLDATIIGPTYLHTPEQFGQILLRVEPNGSQVRLRDVARLGFGGENYQTISKWNGDPAAGFVIKMASGANALDTVAGVKAVIARLEPIFPPGLKVVYPLDTTPFVRHSVKDVMMTLAEAIGLVFLVMLLFLQNVRATLIPTIAIPVVLLGTGAVLAAFGYSINSLTLFGMVLAIGLLVDDAIVVVENVERVMEEEHLPPKEATKRSMEQITGALVGIALVLSAVFVPMAFFGGSGGVIYRQFSITIVSSMILSVLVALVFTPALTSTLLKGSQHESVQRRGFFGWFNAVFTRTQARYGQQVSSITRRPARALVALLIVAGVAALGYQRLPGGYLPEEDQGFMFVQVTAPPGATDSHVLGVLDDISHYFLTQEKQAVDGVFIVSGYSFGGHGQTAGLAFVPLKLWEERPGKRNRVQQIAARFNKHFAGTPEAMVFGFPPPAALELGNATGFDFELIDKAGLGHEALMQARNQLLALAAKDPLLVRVRPNGLDDEPQYRLSVDREKASALGLTISDINDTIQSAWGSNYINDFIDRGRLKRVYIQGDAPSRMLPQDLTSWYLRNGSRQMVPFSAFADGVWMHGSPKLERYNGLSSVEILGEPAPRRSTGEAMAEMERLAAKLPHGIGYDWTGLSYEEKQAGSKALFLYALSLAVVFLCLAALYESWAIPAAVLLVIPLGIVGAALATLFRGLNNDIYFQVGMLTTMGLAVKNAILIVEFAKQNHEAGRNLIDAATEAARQRLRPILMTSFAFILGVAPLVIASGAGSGGQNAIGTGVAGGMITATVLAIFLVPAFFVAVLRLAESRQHRADAVPGLPAAQAAGK